jgi:hypothetical protein
VLAGCAGARGYRQWEEVGRHVKKGQHAQALIDELTAEAEAVL